jgi:hypothetical protein
LARKLNLASWREGHVFTFFKLFSAARFGGILNTTTIIVKICTSGNEGLCIIIMINDQIQKKLFISITYFQS